MYQVLLFIHSWFRWLLLAALIYTLYRSYRGWLGKREFSRGDNRWRHTTATLAHIQLILGLWLYGVSPVTRYFLQHFKEAIHQRQIRFFGMEHGSMMLIAIILVTIGSAVAKRKPGPAQKFKTMSIWYSIALLLILSSIPWPFSPFTARPFFRGI